MSAGVSGTRVLFGLYRIILRLFLLLIGWSKLAFWTEIGLKPLYIYGCIYIGGSFLSHWLETAFFFVITLQD